MKNAAPGQSAPDLAVGSVLEPAFCKLDTRLRATQVRQRLRNKGFRGRVKVCVLIAEHGLRKSRLRLSGAAWLL